MVIVILTSFNTQPEVGWVEKYKSLDKGVASKQSVIVDALVTYIMVSALCFSLSVCVGSFICCY